MKSRLLCGVAIIVVVFFGVILPAAEKKRTASVRSDSRSAYGEMTPHTQKAIERALAFLNSSQNSDGSYTNRVGRKVSDTYFGGTDFDKNVGVTALAAIAFMSHGDMPGRGKYGRNVRDAIKFIMTCRKESTGFISGDDSRMYEHAFATMALAEVYGMTSDSTYPERLRVGEVLRSAIEQLVNAQNVEGAWRYLPQATDSDISVTVTTLMALRAARNAGIYVPVRTIERALGYVRDSARPRDGAFMYQVREQQRGKATRWSYPLTAAGVASLMYAGDYDSKEVLNGIRYLENKRYQPKPSTMRTSFEYFYGQYYASQVFFQVGGEKWKRWYMNTSKDILSNQRPDGSWLDKVGSNYATAMACIILEMPYRYLPLFLR